MATSPRISTVAAIAALDAITTLLNAGGYVNIYEGAPKATLETAEDSQILAHLTLAATAFGGAIDANPGAMATAGTITADSSADNTGIAGHFRAFDSADAPVIQGTVGVSAADLNLNTTSIVQTLPVAMTSWVIKLPEAPGETPGNG